MRILVLTHEFPPVGGGGGHVAKDLCEGLTKLGHEIKVLTADLLGGINEETENQVTKYELTRVPTLRRNLARASLLAMCSFIFSSVLIGFFLIKKWKPDLIHVHFAVPAGPIAWIMSKITGVPYVLTAHLGDVPGGTPEKTAGWFRFIKPFTYPIWNDAKKVIAVSQYTRRLALEHYQVPIEVIHNGVDTSLFEFGKITVHQPPRIVFAGRFVPQKNPLFVIHTLANLLDYEWELVMLGDGLLFQETKEAVQEFSMENRVRQPGWVTPEEVKKEFQRSDILFMPSLSEGLPVVGVQALASGLALLVSDIGGFSDIVEQSVNGYLCDIGKVDSFTAVLMELLTDKVLLTKYRQESLIKSKAFDINRIVSSYETIFLDISKNEILQV